MRSVSADTHAHTHTHTNRTCLTRFKTENQIKEEEYTQREFVVVSFKYLPQFTLGFGANLTSRTSKH